jgi:magnesium-transporting ATPase (P-type)
MDIKDTLGRVSTSTVMSLDRQQTSGWTVDVKVTIILGIAMLLIGFCSFCVSYRNKTISNRKRHVLYTSASTESSRIGNAVQFIFLQVVFTFILLIEIE